MNATPIENLPLNSDTEWPYGVGLCCCGCGKKVGVVDGIKQKFYSKYHERWLRDNKQRELGNLTRHQKQSLAKEKKTKPNKHAITKYLPDAFHISQAKVNELYSDDDRQRPTASEREHQFPHLNAPTVELKNLLKRAVAVESERDSQAAKQPDLFASNAQSDRLNQQLAWIKANQPLLEAISRARSRVDATVNGARIRRREKVDVEFRLLQRIRGRVAAVLKGRVKSSSTLSIIGRTLPEFRAHLEKQFKPGMSWLNYGEWHVDHIRPCASFDFSDPTSLAQCFHYTNLQPMWGAENFKKNSKWEGKLVRRKKPE